MLVGVWCQTGLENMRKEVFFLKFPCTSHALHHIHGVYHVSVWLARNWDLRHDYSHANVRRTVSICMHKSCSGYSWPCCPTLQKWLMDASMTSRYNCGIISVEVIEAKLSLWVSWRSNVLSMQSLYCHHLEGMKTWNTTLYFKNEQNAVVSRGSWWLPDVRSLSPVGAGHKNPWSGTLLENRCQMWGITGGQWATTSPWMLQCNVIYMLWAKHSIKLIVCFEQGKSVMQCKLIEIFSINVNDQE